MVTLKKQLSVLMSVYKKENPVYLDKALHSIWTEQTLKPNEIVLVKDGTLGVELEQTIREWKERLGEKLILHQNERNLGLTKSLNIGLSYVSSDLIARMDSDDIAHPLRFERQVKYLEEHSEIMVLGGAMKEFSGDCKNVINTRHYPLTHREIKKYIMKANPIAHPTVMIRKTLFDNGLRYDERYRNSQDAALWFNVLAHDFQVANLNDTLLFFRMSGDFFSRRSKSYAIDEMKIWFRGISALSGYWSLSYIYPLMRFVLRMLPAAWIQKIYTGRLRKKIV